MLNGNEETLKLSLLAISWSALEAVIREVLIHRSIKICALVLLWLEDFTSFLSPFFLPLMNSSVQVSSLYHCREFLFWGLSSECSSFQSMMVHHHCQLDRIRHHLRNKLLSMSVRVFSEKTKEGRPPECRRCLNWIKRKRWAQNKHFSSSLLRLQRTEHPHTPLRGKINPFSLKMLLVMYDHTNDTQSL